LGGNVLNFSFKIMGLLAIMLGLPACQSASSGALDLQGYPNINVVPTGEAAALTPQQEYEMLASLNAAAAAQPVMTAGEKAAFVARQKRLALIAATHEIDTAKIIAAR
jgi:hypothetical protein